MPFSTHYHRSLERGAQLVGVGDDGRVVLQLPRGNLEVVYPRLLSCRMVEKLVNDPRGGGRWGEAVEHMRRQRLRE